MAGWLGGKWRAFSLKTPNLWPRTFRSDAALEAIVRAAEEKEKVPNVALYNYPSFSGAFSALFAHLFHSRLNLPCLVLPFSSIEPLRVEGLDKCYFLDFVGPRGFATKLSEQSMCAYWRSALPNLVAKGSLYISSCQIAANKLRDKAFKVRLGRGFYGECLGVRADGNSDLSGKIGKQLSLKSATASLRHMAEVAVQVPSPS